MLPKASVDGFFQVVDYTTLSLAELRLPKHARRSSQGPRQPLLCPFKKCVMALYLDLRFPVTLDTCVPDLLNRNLSGVGADWPYFSPSAVFNAATMRFSPTAIPPKLSLFNIYGFIQIFHFFSWDSFSKLYFSGKIVDLIFF